MDVYHVPLSLSGAPISVVAVYNVPQRSLINSQHNHHGLKHWELVVHAWPPLQTVTESCPIFCLRGVTFYNEGTELHGVLTASAPGLHFRLQSSHSSLEDYSDDQEAHE